MKKVKLALICFLILFVSAHAQERVGLVLSGGGAKGMAHIGVLQALEDHNIPIDYITGTSIGAIVGALYAMGHSPTEIKELFLSDEFSYWQRGDVQEQFVFSYKRPTPTPEFISIQFSVTDSLIIQTHLLPTSIINPNQMNIVFLSIFAQATAMANRNFDNLFVPFRCIASNIYKNEAVVLREGDLGNAVRASMTFPLMFKPIEIDGELLFDGGIYNNFPIDVMKEDFKPDYIIGVSVASNPRRPDVRSLMSQIENMVMRHTDYVVNEEDGILIDFQFPDTRLLDFHRTEELFRIGYEKTVKHIEEIKSRVSRRVTQEELQARRNDFRSNFPVLRFRSITAKGVSEGARKYIENSFRNRRQFNTSEDELMYFEEFKRNYFKLLTDNRISSIHPTAVFDEESNSFDLILNVTLNENFVFSIGGNISSSISSQAYFGLEYRKLNAVGLNFRLDGQFGQVYNGIRLTSQIDFPSRVLPFSLKLIGNMHNFNFYNEDRFFYYGFQTPRFTQREQFLKFEFGFPLSMRSTMQFGAGIANLRDYYFQSNQKFLDNIIDINQYTLGSIYARYLVYTLNDKQYPNRGMRLDFKTQLVTGRERFTLLDQPATTFDSWWQSRLQFQYYFNISRTFTLGVLTDAVWSERSFSQNYIASVLQAPRFEPTPHSRYIFNPAFSANHFVAGGIKPIFNITRQLSVQAELYAFLPIRPILADNENRAFHGESFSRHEYMGEISLVWRMPFIAASIFVNHYSSPASNWNVGFNVGYLIFGNRFLN